MARIPEVEISIIRKILKEQDIFCNKELDMAYIDTHAILIQKRTEERYRS